ncbi:MAG TPA: protein translocase subunit SecF [Candidatus Magasanikbacteria bacterium]|nr:protein translocase subunit SecF [Candidatus Magasanikbacteria bacterium]
MNISFVSKQKYFFLVSSLFVVVSIVSLIIYGLKPSIDFTGGTLIELRFTGERPELTEMQSITPPETYGETIVQPVGDEGYLIRLRFITEDEHQSILAAAREKFETPATETAPENKVLEESIETIGPAISESLKQRSVQAVVVVLLAIGSYIAYTFRKVSRPVTSWKYGLAAIIALFHNIIITIGVFSLLGHFMGVEVGISFVLALLTILGFSVHDTIVVFDRIRENLGKYGAHEFESTVNRALNETFVRSINTSVTVLVVLLSLFIFGGESIKYFVLALIIGIFFGTYSSIFIASPLLIVSHRMSKKSK